MCHNLLSNASFHRRTLEIDRALAAEARATGCPWCGAALHQSNYQRAPRGGPAVVETEEFQTRFSFCCADCRRRLTPPSVRFLGRRVYLGVVVVLVAAAAHGLTPRRLQMLRETFRCYNLRRDTVLDWVTWWKEDLPSTRFWRWARGRLGRRIDEDDLPSSLLACFAGTLSLRVLALLGFLRPVTCGTALAGYLMAAGDPQRM